MVAEGAGEAAAAEVRQRQWPRIAMAEGDEGQRTEEEQASDDEAWVCVRYVRARGGRPTTIPPPVNPATAAAAAVQDPRPRLVSRRRRFGSSFKSDPCVLSINIFHRSVYSQLTSPRA